MKIRNKKATFNYKLEGDRFEAGISLIGGEVKSVRAGSANLATAYAKVIKNEVYLVNANIPIVGKKDYDPTRTRKLLLNKKEILAIETKIKQRKLTLVPIALYTKGRLIKLRLALGKSKRKFEKKEAIKTKDIKREIQRELKN